MSARRIRRIAWAGVLLAAIAVVCVEAREGGGMYEFKGYITRYYPLKSLAVPDRTGTLKLVYTVPEHWTYGLTDRDHHWIGEANGNYLVQRSAAGLPLDAGQAEARRQLVKEFRDSLSARGVVGAVEMHEDGSSTFLESTERLAFPDGARIVRNLVRIWPVENTMAGVGFHVIVREGLWERPQTVEIIGLFRQQLGRIHASIVPSVKEQAPQAADESAHGYRDLREVQPFGFMAINLPKRWEEEDDGDTFGYVDPDRPEVEFWLAYHVVMRTRALDGPTYRKVDAGKWEETEHAGLMQRRWMISDSTPDRALIVIANLFIPKEELAKPENRLLEAIIDEEVRRMRIAMPPDSKPATLDLPRKR